MPKLTDNTIVVHPDTGQPVLLVATGDLPDWAEGLVGDHLLDSKPAPAREPEREPEKPADEPAVPPRGGPGSGAPAWRSYAASVGVDVPQEASREDVIEALEAAGKPTE
jgi:hypothetical protein